MHITGCTTHKKAGKPLVPPSSHARPMAYLDGVEVRSKAGHQEGVRAEGLDAHKAAQVDQVDALQIVQRQLVVEKLRELGQLGVIHRLASPHLSGRIPGVAP